jgi:hypothetical protein
MLLWFGGASVGSSSPPRLQFILTLHPRCRAPSSRFSVSPSSWKAGFQHGGKTLTSREIISHPPGLITKIIGQIPSPARWCFRVSQGAHIRAPQGVCESRQAHCRNEILISLDRSVTRCSPSVPQTHGTSLRFITHRLMRIKTITHPIDFQSPAQNRTQLNTIEHKIFTTHPRETGTHPLGCRNILMPMGYNSPFMVQHKKTRINTRCRNPTKSDQIKPKFHSSHPILDSAFSVRRWTFDVFPIPHLTAVATTLASRSD